ncbi:GumC family protein [Lyngbya sp. PCC 8106]|uniref:GumC family protein n=1 Tax=Lyngbya sp. (strain PCC 8106) TaxID=313612 RepID=UPI0000EAD18A|nr:polysaccharide biosynthesis tyrosine autokinase [Lyngbya sp. PCC 8106]EAW38322.1 hypothetical protein L8106_09871 [Lyngbya sp. PCC 8106]
MQSQEYPEDIDLQKYWLILKRHWLPATLVWLLAIGAAVYAAFSIEEEYAAYGKLRLKKQNAISALVTDAGEKIGTLDSLNMQDSPLDTEAEVLRSSPIIKQTIESLNLTTDEGELVNYEDFVSKLGVKGIPGTDVLTISYTSTDPQEAGDIVNTLIEVYIKNNLLVNRAEAVSAREFISEKLPKTERELLKAEEDMRRFKEKNNIIDLQQESTLAVQTIEQLDSQIEATQTQIEKLMARTVEVKNKLGLSSAEAINRSALSESDSVQQVLSKLHEVEDQLAIQRTVFVDLSPEVRILENQKVALEQLLQDRVSQVARSQNISQSDFSLGEIEKGLAEQLVSSEAEIEGLRKQLESLYAIHAEQQQRAKILPQLEQTQRELERKVEAAQATYTTLVDRLQQVQIAENQNVGNAQIVSPAIISQYPVSTSKKIVVAMGIIVGGVLYVIVSFVLELLDRSIKTSKELRNIFNSYTLLGMIPNSKKKKVSFPGKRLESVIPEHQAIKDPHSIISEAYRMLQANLKFISPDHELNFIVVTSAVSQEGKSTISANLAAAMSQVGSRVLLIDADLHHPQQHHIWNLTNEVGLSDVIVNKVELNSAIKRISYNLDVLPSGVIPPNSLALLESKRMNSLMKDLRAIYDFIIVDTSPLLLVADALTLGKKSDGILLVARPKVIDSVSAIAAKDLLTKSGQKVLGLVTNGVVVENEPDSYFHYAKSYFKNDTNVTYLQNEDCLQSHL